MNWPVWKIRLVERERVLFAGEMVASERPYVVTLYERGDVEGPTLRRVCPGGTFGAPIRYTHAGAIRKAADLNQ